jgi:hypothetical protein
MLSQGGDGAFQVHGVPKCDGGDDQVESAGTLALIFEAAVAHFPLAIEEDGAGESVPGLAFVEPDLHTSAQLRVSHPFQHKEGALDTPDFAKRCVETVLSRVACEFADNERGGHRPISDGSGEAQDLLPLRFNQQKVELAPNKRSESRMIALLPRYIEPLVGKVTNARCEAKAQKMAECKDVVGKTARIGVVLLDSQIGLMVEPR